MEKGSVMHIYIPEWLVAFAIFAGIIYLAIGILLLPYMFYRIHQSMKGNPGWTWKTTLIGRKFGIRSILAPIFSILLWPWALWEL